MQLYVSVENEISRELYTYLMNEYLQAWRSHQTKYFWKNSIENKVNFITLPLVAFAFKSDKNVGHIEPLNTRKNLLDFV